MTDTVVQYHRDGYGQPARPAVNVKDHHSGQDFVIAVERLIGGPASGLLGDSDAVTHRYPDTLHDHAYEAVVRRFWEDAREVADNLGLGPIEQEGRSGGWLVLTDGYDPQDHPEPSHVNEWPEAERSCSGCDERRDWLTAYRLLSTWCADQVRTAPARVAALAQQLAMDEVGAEPARRMFAFEIAAEGPHYEPEGVSL